MQAYVPYAMFRQVVRWTWILSFVSQHGGRKDRRIDMLESTSWIYRRFLRIWRQELTTYVLSTCKPRIKPLSFQPCPGSQHKARSMPTTQDVGKRPAPEGGSITIPKAGAKSYSQDPLLSVNTAIIYEIWFGWWSMKGRLINRAIVLWDICLWDYKWASCYHSIYYYSRWLIRPHVRQLYSGR